MTKILSHIKKGTEGNVYTSYTDGIGYTITKAFFNFESLQIVPIPERIKIFGRFPTIFPKIYETFPDGYVMERLSEVNFPDDMVLYSRDDPYFDFYGEVYRMTGQFVERRTSEAVLPYGVRRVGVDFLLPNGADRKIKVSDAHHPNFGRDSNGVVKFFDPILSYG